MRSFFSSPASLWCSSVPPPLFLSPTRLCLSKSNLLSLKSNLLSHLSRPMKKPVQVELLFPEVEPAVPSVKTNEKRNVDANIHGEQLLIFDVGRHHARVPAVNGPRAEGGERTQMVPFGGNAAKVDQK
ncbi:hypothetical protein niasHS_004505 [Heterodera schachtii]|uniref:Uncharacterized protein n=1 Tax=Heterodera schachtii TaxID=97005 RepID=A0ABD2JME8_HETSC